MLNRKLLAAPACLIAMLFSLSTQAHAAVTITGTVGSSGKYLVSGSLVNTTTHDVMKISFEDTTTGTNLALCAGSASDFAAGTCTTRLSDSGGPGFVFLTIIDIATLNGQDIFVIREVGSADASFSLKIE